MTQTQRIIRYAQLIEDGCPEEEAHRILQQEQHEQDCLLSEEN